MERKIYPIYLSHSVESDAIEAFGNGLGQLLEKEGIDADIVVPEKNIKGNLDINSLDTTDIFITLLTPDYFDSDWNLEELDSYISLTRRKWPDAWKEKVILVNLERWSQEHLYSTSNEAIIEAASTIKPFNLTRWYKKYLDNPKELQPGMLQKELIPIVNQISRLIKSGSESPESTQASFVTEDPGISPTIEPEEGPSGSKAKVKPDNQGKEQKEEKTKKQRKTRDKEQDFDFKLENKAATDLWTVEDKLGYRAYARAIAQPILDEVTKPPLTIAIQAPWGYGKTSLMRMIQRILDPQNPTFKDLPKAQQMADPEAALNEEQEEMETTTKYSTMFKVLKEENENPEMGMLGENKDRMHTVWFNPLYFHNSDQVWAGMAHAILQQLSSQLPSRLKIEEFWLRLGAKRINAEAIRRDVHKQVFEKMLPKAVFYAITGILFILVILLTNTSSWWLLTSLLPFITPFFHFNYLKKKAKNWTLDKKFEEYVTEPDYSGKLGFLHLMDHDIDRALELLVGDGTVVIFIDDLDRCHPDIISEIVLAINQFISLPHRRTIFVLGMDSKMVAAALEDSQEFKSKIGDSNFAQKSFGWLFLEKFIQLPFFIPHISDDRLRDLLKSKMESGKKEEPEKEQELREKVQELKSKIDETDDLEKLSEYSTEVASSLKDSGMEALELEDVISKKVSRKLKDPEGEEMNKIINLAIREENLNPRSLIRFLNMSRLLRHIQTVKGMDLTNKNARRLVTRGAHLMLNWPEILLWMQSQENSWTEAGEKIKAVIDLEKITNTSKDYEKWKEGIIKKWGEERSKILLDPGFYDFLKLITNDPPGLSELYNTGHI